MDTHAYSTTLTDAEWELVLPLLPSPSRTGRPRRHSLRRLLDAIFYAVRAGHAWRLLPHEWPPWKTVCHYFSQWRLDGTCGAMHAALRDALVEALRRHVGSYAPPRT